MNAAGENTVSPFPYNSMYSVVQQLKAVGGDCRLSRFAVFLRQPSNRDPFYPYYIVHPPHDHFLNVRLLFLAEVRPIPDTPKTLASRLALPPKSRKIIKNKSQGATPGSCTLQQPNIARCDTTTSHPATLSHRTLRRRAITPCNFRLSHPATRKPRFQARKIAWSRRFMRRDTAQERSSNSALPESQGDIPLRVPGRDTAAPAICRHACEACVQARR